MSSGTSHIFLGSSLFPDFLLFLEFFLFQDYFLLHSAPQVSLLGNRSPLSLHVLGLVVEEVLDLLMRLDCLLPRF